MKAILQSGFGQKILTVMKNDGMPFYFRIQRENMLNFGEVISGKIIQKNETLRGYFVKTDKKSRVDMCCSVFIPTNEKLKEGDSVFVEITKEARFGKDATGRLTAETICRLPDITANLPPEISPIENDTTNLTDSLIEEALEADIGLARGAEIHIERTNGCWCIDVDSATSLLSLREINAQAVELIAKQIILKNLSGIILIDFAGFKSKAEQEELVLQIKRLLKSDKRTTIYGFTRTKLLELKRMRTTASLIDLFLTPGGYMTPTALVPMIMRAVFKAKSGKAVLVVHPSVLPYLPQDISAYCDVQTNGNVAPDYFEVKG